MRNQRFTRQWTESDIHQIAVLLRAGKTGSQIAAEFGVSRNSAISIIHRAPELRAIGLARSPVSAADRPPPQPRAPKPKPSLRLVHTTQQATVDAWLAANGGPRKFERGARSDFDAIKTFLEQRGYTFGGWQGKFKLSHGKGRPRVLYWRQVMVEVDAIRISEGLQPFSTGVPERRRRA